jgi:hypothetical protein
MYGISWLAKKLLGSQYGHCCIEASYLVTLGSDATAIYLRTRHSPFFLSELRLWRFSPCMDGGQFPASKQAVRGGDMASGRE